MFGAVCARVGLGLRGGKRARVSASQPESTDKAAASASQSVPHQAPSSVIHPRTEAQLEAHAKQNGSAARFAINRRVHQCLPSLLPQPERAQRVPHAARRPPRRPRHPQHRAPPRADPGPRYLMVTPVRALAHSRRPNSAAGRAAWALPRSTAAYTNSRRKLMGDPPSPCTTPRSTGRTLSIDRNVLHHGLMANTRGLKGGPSDVSLGLTPLRLAREHDKLASLAHVL